MWKNININKNNIETKTASAVLFKMPHKSNYDGFVFWHPAKLVRDGRHSNSVSVGYTDDFKFRIKRISQKTFAVLDEKEISVTEFEEAFGVMDENIIASKKDTENYLLIEDPQKVDKEVKIMDELKNE